MNKEWSELNKTMQAQIKKKETYKEGIETLFALRSTLMDTIAAFREKLDRQDFDAMPFISADGYHSKNIAYSLWHIFRIEDIVAITTGNELIKEQISDFTQKLDIKELFAYIFEVKESTEAILEQLPFEELKRKISDDRKEKLISLSVVSKEENAAWLVDYWCGKDIRGLIQMPFSRHWIMHIEASLRIKNRIHA